MTPNNVNYSTAQSHLLNCANECTTVLIVPFDVFIFIVVK